MIPTRWYAYFRDSKNEQIYFRLIVSEGLDIAEMMAMKLSDLNKDKLVGVMVAPELYQKTSATEEDNDVRE